MATPATGDKPRTFVHDNSATDEVRAREGFVSLASDDRRPVGTVKQRGIRGLATSDQQLLEAVQGLQATMDQILDVLLNQLK